MTLLPIQGVILTGELYEESQLMLIPLKNPSIDSDDCANCKLCRNGTPMRIRFAWGRICILSCLCRRHFGESFMEWRARRQSVVGLGRIPLLGIDNWFFFAIYGHGIAKKNQLSAIKNRFWIYSQSIPIPRFLGIGPALFGRRFEHVGFADKQIRDLEWSVFAVSLLRHVGS